MIIKLLYELAIAWLGWARVNLAYAIYPQDYMWADLEAEDHYLNEAIKALGSECEYILNTPMRWAACVEVRMWKRAGLMRKDFYDALRDYGGFDARDAIELFHAYIYNLNIIEAWRLMRLIKAGVLWPNSQAHRLLLSCNAA